jgi:sugar/nucleoside kinase (ribokinase family)
MLARRRASYSRHEKKILPSRSASNLTAANSGAGDCFNAGLIAGLCRVTQW